MREPAKPQRHPRGAKHRADIAHPSWLRQALQHRRQAGKQQPHLGAFGSQRLRQRTDHIGQPAGLDQRKHFGGRVQNFHAAIFSSISAVTRQMPLGLR